MVSLSACQLMSNRPAEFPVDHLYEVDMVNKVCARWEILNPQTLNAIHDKNLPLSDCDGILGFKYDDYVKAKRWIESKQK